MSDDLISRKALLDRFRYEDKESESDKAWICAVRRMIKEQPTAFDKEKVIEELKGEIELVVHNPMIAGRYIKKSRAIEIVEKCGLSDI